MHSWWGFSFLQGGGETFLQYWRPHIDSKYVTENLTSDSMYACLHISKFLSACATDWGTSRGLMNDLSLALLTHCTFLDICGMISWTPWRHSYRLSVSWRLYVASYFQHCRLCHLYFPGNAHNLAHDSSWETGYDICRSLVGQQAAVWYYTHSTEVGGWVRSGFLSCFPLVSLSFADGPIGISDCHAKGWNSWWGMGTK